ncbi:MAG: AAA family ATPase [Myxococcota bacterium]
MYISSVHVQNFRNLKDCQLSLQPGLNVVVGRNNVGKSNLVDAIRHALGPAASAGELPGLDRTDFREGDKSQLEPMKVALTFADLTDGRCPGRC